MFKQTGENTWVKLSAPWYTIHRELKALFKNDPEVKVSPLDKDTKEENGKYYIYISSNNYEKLCAIEKVIKSDYDFGNVHVYVKFTCENKAEDWEQVLKTAFAGNTAVNAIKEVLDLFDEYYCVIFEDKVIQFYNDDTSDYFRNWNGLYTDVAKDLFKDNPDITFSIKKIK